ncbi:hypothetical protein FRC09_009923 [Ceratobasidium sp. 395]|nr:hypothetical protein FRC09_009923 [Ceratobasidium sp. 395]
MSSRRSKRDRFRNFLGESSEALKEVFQPRSPRPLSSSTLESDTSSSIPTLKTSATVASDIPLSIHGAKDTALAVLKASLKTLDSAIGLAPTFKSAVGILTDCIDGVPAAVANCNKFNELALSIAMLAQGLEEQSRQANPARMAKTIEDALQELQNEAIDIREKQDRTRARAYVEAEQDIDDLTRCYRRVEALFRQLHVSTSTTNHSIPRADTLEERRDSERVEDREREPDPLNPAKMAIYDSNASSQLGRRGCTPNTRQVVLRRLQDWASDPKGAKVYWMNGMAGTGKTTIAYSFCRILEASNQLAASFFCSRSLPECRDVTRITPTLASQLSRFCRPMTHIISRVLENDPDACVRGVMTQFEKLISEPMLQVKDRLPYGLPIVVVDALDECSDYGDARSFLSVLLRFAQDLPVRFFVTCRPDSTALTKLTDRGETSYSLLHLHDIEQSLVQADIETYLADELKPMQATPTQIHELTNKSGALFIFAATAVRYLGLDKPSIDHQMRLGILLGVSSYQGSKAYRPLDMLYTAILSSALKDDDLEPWDKDNIKLLLHTVVCAREPLSLEGLARLLRLATVNQAQRAIDPLRSVLHMDERSGLVSALHASFPDYMLTVERSGEFFCDRSEHHELLSRRCFEVMRDMLRFNICGLESSYMLDQDIPDLTSRIDRSIPPHLFYACRYWSEHLTLAAEPGVLLDYISEFLCRQVLFWAEAMNLKQATRAGEVILADTNRWMKVRMRVCDMISSLTRYKSKQLVTELHAICQDAQKFMTVVGASPVNQCTPHIYLSVLAIWDRSEPMWVYYGVRMQKLVWTTGTAIDNRESAGLAVWQYKIWVFSVAVSRDGRWVASGSYDHTVSIWDSHAGQIVAGPLVGHTDVVHSVAFSLDSDRVVSGSKDKTIRIWDSRTGKPVAGPFEGHTDQVRSVVFSPDDRHVASGSHDCTVRIWDAKTGQAMEHPCSGHTDWVLSVAYSPNGDFIASGSADCSIRIWHAKNGGSYLGPLNRHSGSVCSVRYSPTGSFIVSGSNDHTVRVWNSHSGDLIAGPFEGHTDIVRSVAYSPDSTHIVSSSEDHTIRIWDAQTGQAVAGPLRGHTGWVYAAVYMPDGNRIVSCSRDYTIRIWDARTRHTRSSLSEGHTAGVSSVAFSPDGSRIVSGSNDCTVCIWDAKTGRRPVGPLKGHTGYVNSVAFSPTGDRVASASDDQTVRVWDTRNGAVLAGPFKEHTGEVRSVTFSPDDHHLASGSEDCTLCVWNTRNGNIVAGPLEGHTDGVISVAYSQDGKRIVSGSGDRSLRVWNVHAGATVTSPFEGHTGQVNSVSYSPDKFHILSCSWDHTIRIWDAESGQTILGPLTGHTDVVWSAMYSPDGRYIVSGSFDQTIRIWDAETGDDLTGPFRAHTHRVVSVTFSPDSQLIASSSLDSTIRVWDTKKCLATSRDSKYWTVSEDGWVVGNDSSLLFWVPADLRPMLKWPQNTVLIHQQGSFELDFTDAALGTRWTECWKSE